MSLAVTSGSTAPQLSRYVTELPQKIAHEQGRKAALYSMASKVCLIAFLAIAAVVLAISIGALPPLCGHHPPLTPQHSCFHRGRSKIHDEVAGMFRRGRTS